MKEDLDRKEGTVPPGIEIPGIPARKLVMGNYTSREDLRATVAKALEHNVRTSDGMNWNLQDLVYEALSEEWRKRDGEDDDPWENHGPDGYQPPSYEPVNPERRTAQTPSDGLI